MSEKVLCPGCGAYTSDVAHAVDEDAPCPHCGLPASAIAAVTEVRQSQANTRLREQLEAALLDRGRLIAWVEELEAVLSQVRAALDDLPDRPNLPDRESL